MSKYIFIFLCSLIFGLPRYSLEEATSCMACHINPTGSGMRNDYGSNIYSIDNLPLNKWSSQSDENWDGYITENIQIGGDFRIQMFKNNEENKVFPMQSDLYSNIDINKNANLYFKIDLSRQLTDEYFVLFDDVIKNTWIKLGQSIPNYGLRIDDHTSFTRGGNVNSLFSGNNTDYDEGLFFDVYTSPPILFELGSKIKNTSFSLSLGNNYLTTNSEDGMVNFSSSLSSYYNVDDLNLLTGFSYMKELDIESYSIFGGISIDKLSLMFEVDKSTNWIEQGIDSYVNMLQMIYKPIQGVHFIAKYDYFDKDFDLLNGSLERKTIGVEIYPLNMFEINFQLREYEVENLLLDSNKKEEILMQIHSWF